MLAIRISCALEFGSERRLGVGWDPIACGMKITGLDALSHNLRELESAVSDLDGDIAQVSFDPHDPQSIEHAIQEVNLVIDQKIRDHVGNEMVSNLAEALKESYRTGILERAAAARLAGNQEE